MLYQLICLLIFLMTADVKPITCNRITDNDLALSDELLDEMGGIGIVVVFGLLTILYILL